MSFLKRLFGGGDAATATSAATHEAIEHNGFTIRPTPFAEEGQFQTCGIVSKEISGETREHRFIRADRFASEADAVAHSIRKGMQLVDEQGETIFRKG